MAIGKTLLTFIRNTMILTLKGKIPSKKNSKQIVCRGKFPKVLCSKAYREWHEQASWELYTQKKELGISNCEIRLIFTPPDKRKYDLTNKAESVMDLLVDTGILTDDNYEVVPKLTLELGTGDPGCVIHIN
jgi:Holliday junction resolvase RusA-like endonuclease